MNAETQFWVCRLVCQYLPRVSRFCWLKGISNRCCSIVNVMSVENFGWLVKGSTIQQWSGQVTTVRTPTMCSLTKQKHIILWFPYKPCGSAFLYQGLGRILYPPASSLQLAAVPCRDDRPSLKATTTPACRAASDLWFTASVIAVSWLGEEPTATAASTARPSAPEADRLRFHHRSIISSWNVALTSVRFSPDSATVVPFGLIFVVVFERLHFSTVYPIWRGPAGSANTGVNQQFMKVYLALKLYILF